MKFVVMTIGIANAMRENSKEHISAAAVNFNSFHSLSIRPFCVYLSLHERFGAKCVYAWAMAMDDYGMKREIAHNGRGVRGEAQRMET